MQVIKGRGVDQKLNNVVVGTDSGMAQLSLKGGPAPTRHGLNVVVDGVVQSTGNIWMFCPPYPARILRGGQNIRGGKTFGFRF